MTAFVVALLVILVVVELGLGLLHGLRADRRRATVSTWTWPVSRQADYPQDVEDQS